MAWHDEESFNNGGIDSLSTQLSPPTFCVIPLSVSEVLDTTVPQPIIEPPSDTGHFICPLYSKIITAKKITPLNPKQ